MALKIEISGEQGEGKTLVASIIGNALVDHGFAVGYSSEGVRTSLPRIDRTDVDDTPIDIVETQSPPGPRCDLMHQTTIDSQSKRIAELEAELEARISGAKKLKDRLNAAEIREDQVRADLGKALDDNRRLLGKVQAYRAVVADLLG